MMTSAAASKNKTLNLRGLIIGLAIGASVLHQDATAAQALVALGSGATFAVLAATTVTTIPTTTVNGDLGVSPGNTITGSPIVNGTMHLGDPAAAQAQLDLTTAYNDAAGRTVDAITVAGNLGGQTLAPGLYKSATSLEKTITVPLSGSTQFYRNRAATALTLTGITISGGNVVITYN